MEKVQTNNDRRTKERLKTRNFAARNAYFIRLYSISRDMIVYKEKIIFNRLLKQLSY